MHLEENNVPMWLIPKHSQKLQKKSFCIAEHRHLGIQRWSPRGHILKSLALASRPQALENWPVLGSRTALLFELLKFCGALKKFFGKRCFVEIANFLEIA